MVFKPQNNVVPGPSGCKCIYIYIHLYVCVYIYIYNIDFGGLKYVNRTSEGLFGGPGCCKQMRAHGNKERNQYDMDDGI